MLLRDGRTQNLKELAPSLGLEIWVTVQTFNNCASSTMYFTVEILPLLSVTCGKAGHSLQVVINIKGCIVLGNLRDA